MWTEAFIYEMKWSEVKCVELKCVEFPIFGSVSFLLKFSILFSKNHGRFDFETP